ncbi:hypothetical protein D3273_24735 [Lichenibacterium minor]|uniref:Uncharacterized protein n=1 Tax=Lichenibacterium minor TaxID=2316528 RepID=A0A4Q2TZV5_9HYPH|nr:hypothetical protein [Lichenibacterium minor]RYC29320.1 hypothetical protein D3273_24735 [Lichenibacterium minor]
MDPQLGPALSASDLKGVADWWALPCGRPEPFDGDAYLDLANALMTALTPYLATVKLPEIRAALVKAVAATTSAPVFHGTDNDVFKLSLDLREEIYSEVMRFRRAVLHDVATGAVDA